MATATTVAPAHVIDLPGDDESAGLDDYAEIVVREIGQRTNVTLVAQSLGAFTDNVRNLSHFQD